MRPLALPRPPAYILRPTTCTAVVAASVAAAVLLLLLRCCILRYVIVNFNGAALNVNVNDERPNCLIDITTERRRAVCCVQRCHATCHLPHATPSV